MKQKTIYNQLWLQCLCVFLAEYYLLNAMVPIQRRIWYLILLNQLKCSIEFEFKTNANRKMQMQHIFIAIQNIENWTSIQDSILCKSNTHTKKDRAKNEQRRKKNGNINKWCASTGSVFYCYTQVRFVYTSPERTSVFCQWHAAPSLYWRLSNNQFASQKLYPS